MKNNEFTKFKLDTRLIDKLNKKRITIPTKIQDEVIPKIQKNEDIIGQSKTGTGKTISYLLPIINMMIIDKSPTLIISPTKELAKQIFDEIQFFTKELNFKSFLLISGENIEKQEARIKNGFDIIVGVTGRIIKLVDSGNLKLSNIKKIVLDEADFLIDLGFIKDLERIYSLSKNCKQFLVFSATLSQKTKETLDLIKNQKNSVRIDAKNKIPENIENYYFPMEKENRDEFLLDIIKNINPYLCLIFVRTKKESNWLYGILKENKYLVGCLNGDLTSSQRKKSIDDFKNAKTQFLIATDLASRGLDVDGINYIINYTLPLNELDYLHRAGRTGRMDSKGIVYSICNQLDEGYLKKYSINLEFKLEALRVLKSGISQYKNYTGVKPRFNLEEIKKQEHIKQIKKKEKEYNVKKTGRNTKRR